MKYLRRMMSFLAVKLALFALCVSVLICAFYLAFNLGNASVLISEGLEKRMSVIFTREDAVALNNYFAATCLESDRALEGAFSNESWYLAYTIKSFEHEVDIEEINGWPWSDKIRYTVVERISDLNGTRKAAYAELAGVKPPMWPSGRYYIWLEKQDNGQWKISGIYQIGEFPVET